MTAYVSCYKSLTGQQNAHNINAQPNCDLSHPDVTSLTDLSRIEVLAVVQRRAISPWPFSNGKDKALRVGNLYLLHSAEKTRYMYYGDVHVLGTKYHDIVFYMNVLFYTL